MRRIGVPRGARQALLWGHHLDPGARDTAKDRLLNFVANRKWFDCLRLSDAKLEIYDRELRLYRPECIVAYPSALAALASHIARTGRAPNYPLNCLVTGAEKLYDSQREQIEAVFRKPVFERYGGRDVGGLAFQRDGTANGIFEVDWAGVLVEPANLEASSSIVVTKLWGDAMPMIRYLNDDVAVFPKGTRIGHPSYYLEQIVGRSVDRIALPDGGWVHGNHFPHLLKDFPLKEYQIRQAKNFEVTVSLVPGPGFSPEHTQRILANLKANLPGITVHTEFVATTPRTRANKWRPVVSEVAQ
jgi:phenylacetate-CoA ligase